MIIGVKLRELREYRDLTQREVAKHLNCSYKQISNYELDKRTPDYQTLVDLCDLYEVTVDYVLGRTLNPQHFHSIPLSQNQMDLLNVLDKLDDKRQQEVIRFAKLNLLDILK